MFVATTDPGSTKLCRSDMFVATTAPGTIKLRRSGMFVATTNPNSTNLLRSGMFVATPASGHGSWYLLSRACATKPQDTRYRTRKFIGTVGDANNGHRIGPQEIV